MINAGYATASSATMTALRYDIGIAGGTLTLDRASNSGITGLTKAGATYTGTTSVTSGVFTVLPVIEGALTGSGPSGGAIMQMTTGTGIGRVTGGLNLGTSSGAIFSLGIGSGVTATSGSAGMLMLNNNLANTFTGTTTMNAGTLSLNTGGLSVSNAIIGQTGAVTIANSSASSYLLNLSNSTTQTLGPGISVTINGSPYVTGISPLQSVLGL